MDQWCNVTFPVTLLVRLKSSQHVLQCPIETFTHSIAHQMIECCAGLLTSGDLTQLTYDAALKVGPLV